MDPLAVLDQILTIVSFIKETVQGVQSNKEKCKRLADRCAAIGQVLALPSLKEQLKGQEVPVALTNVASVLTDAQGFIDAYGAKNFLKKLISWKSVQEEFEDLNNRLNSSVVDCNLLITTQLKGDVESKKVKLIAEKQYEPTLVLESQDIINTFEDSENSGLVIWVDHQYKNNEKLIQKLAVTAPNIAVLGCDSTTSLKSIYLQNRSTKMGCIGRFRIITNRARPESNGSFNERAAHDVVDLMRDLDPTTKTPILMFTGTVTNVTNLNKELGTKNLAQDQFIQATNSADIVERFILMSTVLFVWKDIEGDVGTMKLLQHFFSLGVVCITKATEDEARSWLRDNQDLKYNPKFRIVTNRYYENFLRNLRQTHGFRTPVLIYTRTTLLDELTKKLGPLGQILVTDKETVAKDFGLMLKLPWEENKTLTDSNNDSFFMSPLSALSRQAITDDARVSIDNLSTTSTNNQNKVQINVNVQVQTKTVMNAPAPKPIPPFSRGTLNISYIKCEKLAPKDDNGLSDPYVIFKCRKTIKKTVVIKENLNPEWKSVFIQLDIADQNELIAVEVWDWDKIGKDEFEGQRIIDFNEIYPEIAVGKTRKTYTLQQRSGKSNDKVSGTITIELSFQRKN